MPPAFNDRAPKSLTAAPSPHLSSASSADNGAVLLVANYPSDVGYAWWLMENFWSIIATEISAQGRKCYLAYPEIREIPPIIRQAPLHIVNLKVDWTPSRRVLQFLRTERIRSVYLTDWPYVHWLYALWRVAGVRRITLHDHKPGDRPRARTLKRLVHWALHASVITACTHYVGVSKYVGERLRESTCVPARRCLVVENGIAVFEPDTGRCNVRRSLGIPENAILIVLVSRATVYKGLDFAIECFSRLREDSAIWANTYVLHCGDGPDLAEFRRWSEKSGLTPNVQFLGGRPDVRAILGASNLAFHPSRGEGLSLAILEFMCARLAVVVPDSPSVCAPVLDGVTGLVYRAGDHREACRAILRLVLDNSLRERMGAAARERVKERFSLEKTNQSFTRQVVPLL